MRRRGLRSCREYPGYSVDAAGVVYTHWTNVRLAGARGGFGRAIDERVSHAIRPEPDKDGYLRVRLRKNGRRVWVRVNVLVCTAFKGPRPTESHQCRHKNGDRRNNAARNLLWGTPLENAADKVEHGTVLAGCDHPLAKFKPHEAREIHEDFASGMQPALIAAVRNVSVLTIRDLLAGRTYKQFRRA